MNTSSGILDMRAEGFGGGWVEVGLVTAYMEVIPLYDKRRGERGKSRTNYWGTSTFRGEELVGRV